MSYAVYSSLSFFGPRRGGELPGTWFVAALGRVEHEAAAVRQTLWRMEQAGELIGRSAGRQRFYRFTALAGAEARLGLGRIMDPVPARWDGAWTVVHLRFGAGRRTQRERVVAALHAGGFRSPLPGVFLHPREREGELRAIVGAAGEDRLTVFRGTRVDGRPDGEFVRGLWDLDALDTRYRTFLAEWGPELKRRQWRPEEAFAARFALVFSYLDIAWHDPELPEALLPGRWSGGKARALARALYNRLKPGALALSETLLSRSRGMVPA